MAFKIRDLMINVASSEPREGAGEAAPAGCVGRCNTLQTGKLVCGRWITYLTIDTPYTCKCTHRSGHYPCACTHQTGPCACTHQTGYGETPGWPNPYPPCGCTHPSGRWYTPAAQETLESLTEVKAELQLALAEVDEQIKCIEQGLQPKTLEEVEGLETKLKEALGELDRIKSELKNK